MRRRRVVEAVLVTVGAAAVLTPVLLAGASGWQVGAVAAGLALLLTGVWRLAGHVMPEERRFAALRREVDGFLKDVRELNRLAVEGKTVEAESLRVRLHGRVDALVDAAGEEGSR